MFSNMKASTLFSAITLATAGVSAAPVLQARSNWVDSVDSISYNTTLPEGWFGQALADFQPYLKVESGCVPFPSVDNINGNLNSGLKPTGMMNGDCSTSPGQVYARTGWSGEGEARRWALMYAWYFPKNQNFDLLPTSGHRHDWQNVIIWFTDDTDDISINPVLGVSYSGLDGSYTQLESKVAKLPHFQDDTHLLVSYTKASLTGLHIVGDTTTVGGQQPVVAWAMLSAAAQDALNTADFGTGVTVPLNDANFQTIVDANRVF